MHFLSAFGIKVGRSAFQVETHIMGKPAFASSPVQLQLKGLVQLDERNVNQKKG